MTDDIEQLKAATREAHEAIKDLRALVKEAREVAGMLPQVVYAATTERIEDEVEAGLTAYGDAITDAINNATAAVYRRFDMLADVLLGETKRARRSGEPSLHDLAERLVRRAQESDMTKGNT